MTVIDATACGVSPSNPDNFSAICAALAAAAGATLQLPAGVLHVDASQSTGPITGLGANTTIIGAGKSRTTLEVQLHDSVFMGVFNLWAGGLDVQNTGFRFLVPADTACVSALFMITGSDIAFTRCAFYGNNDVSSGLSNNHAALFLFAGSGTQEKLRLERCSWSNFHAPFVKANTSASTQRTIKLIDCDAANNAMGHITLNSPTGLMEDVQIDDFEGGDQKGCGAGLGHMISLASIKDVRITRPRLIGVTDTAAIYAEEGCDGLVVDDAIVRVSSPWAGYGHGFMAQSNNVGGVMRAPKNVDVVNSYLSGGGPGSVGVNLIDASGACPLAEVNVRGNTIVGFDKGQTFNTAMDTIWGGENSFEACATAISSTAALTPASCDDNAYVNCATVFNVLCGQAGKSHFVGTLGTIATAPGGFLMLREWSFTPSPQSLGASQTTWLPTMPLGKVMRGAVGVSAERASWAALQCSANALWNGATLTTTTAGYVKAAVGSIDLSGFDANAGMLRVGVYNAGAVITGAAVRVSFEGEHVFD